MRSNLLDGDVPADKTYDSSSYMSSGTSSSTSGVASYFSADETKTVTRRTFSLIVLSAIVLLIIAISLALALHFKRTTVIDDNNNPVVPPDPSNLAANIQSADLMVHLNSLQAAAAQFNKTRVITLGGFNASVDYVYNTLSQNTNFKLQKQYFPVERWFVNLGATSLTSYDSDGNNYTYIYGTDYQAITNSGVQGPNVENATVAYVANGGCNQVDWDNYNQSVPIAGQIAITLRLDNVCNFTRQATWAQNYGAIGLIVYNQENNPDLLTNLAVTQYTAIPVFLTTFQVGNGFVQASLAGSGFYIDMVLSLANTNTVVVTNIIADTMTGDITSTVVVGSHMDSVQAGPGINDNGSGSSANLAMALQVDKMLKAGVWGSSLPNRIRFMWFGAEEQGLLGSRYHVQQAQQSTVPGERASDYAVMLNYDMLGQNHKNR